jgi:mannose-6-phosphate isomerase-like protein (cupin superfamily)
MLKELTINKKSSISLQKHHHRSEYWTVISGRPKITVGKKVCFKKINESIFIPKGSIHRIENIYSKTIKIVEAQLGDILKESDIIRYQDMYGRIK